MGDEDDALAEQSLQSEKFVLHLTPDQRIERAERLVEQPDVGFDGETARDPDALLLAAGQLARKAVFPPGQSDEGDHLPRTPIALLARQALDTEWIGDIVQHVEMRQQTEILEHHPHLVAAELDQLPFLQREQVAPGDVMVRRSARPVATDSAPPSISLIPTGP